MSDIANKIMDDLWANGFVPGDKVLQLIAKHVTPVEQEVERLRAELAVADGDRNTLRVGMAVLIGAARAAGGDDATGQ